MLRSYLARHRRYVIEVTFATGAVSTYGLFKQHEEAVALLGSRWATVAPDPHDQYADVTAAVVRRRHPGEPLRPVHDLMGRRFVLVP